LGEVYNEDDQKCDAPENVPGWWVAVTTVACMTPVS
jgi:hypothetical protein